jgi:tetratricopeptide (TPR) repeat protein
MRGRFRAAWLGLCLCAAPLAAAEEVPAVRILRTGGLKAESAALLVSGEQGGSIHVAVLPLLFPGSAGKVRIPIILEIDGATLLKGNTGNVLRIEVCLYALAASGPEAGGVQGSLLETIEIDLARDATVRAAVERSGVQYAAELALPPGDYSLRALVRNALTGEVGLRILNLAVHDPAAGALLLAPSFANPAADSWLAALSKSAQGSPAALADGGLPAAQPVLGVDQEARFELPLWKTRAPEALRVEILRPDGGRAAELPAKIEARREFAGLDRLTVSFTPAGLEPGRYLIRALVSGSDAPAAATPFVLLATGNEGKVWAELLHPQGPQSAPREASADHPEPAQPKRRRLTAGPVRKAYLDALHLLAAGDEPAARKAVAALEVSLLAGTGSAMPEDVADIELGVAKDLVGTAGAAAPQSLLPLAILHTSLYRDSQQDHRPLVTTHAREMVFSLASMVADRRDAARVLLALAAQLVRSAPPGLSERAFRQVLTFEEDNEAALLNLAVDAERHGRYPETVSLCERLLRAHPDNAEARLRLAVNLRRLGKPRDADKLLAGLIQGPAATTETWVLALAYHETGRALVAAGQLDAAESLLRAGLKRLPGDEKLLIELAGLFDLRHDPAQARQLLAAFKPPRETAEAARNRYNRMPYESLDQVWNDLVRSLPEALPSLAAALQHKGP